jgi:3-dehydroquinate synthetase
VETLRSLEPEQFASGMAEAIKHGILEGGITSRIWKTPREGTAAKEA